MKKFLSIATALALVLLFSTGCEKHAYTISTNIFMYSTGGRAKTLGFDVSMKKGQTIYIYAASEDKVRFTGGAYEVSLSGENAAPETSPLSVSTGDFKGEGAILVNALSSGQQDISINYQINGFKLYKTVTVKIK